MERYFYKNFLFSFYGKMNKIIVKDFDNYAHLFKELLQNPYLVNTLININPSIEKYVDKKVLATAKFLDYDKDYNKINNEILNKNELTLSDIKEILYKGTEINFENNGKFEQIFSILYKQDKKAYYELVILWPSQININNKKDINLLLKNPFLLGKVDENNVMYIADIFEKDIKYLDFIKYKDLKFYRNLISCKPHFFAEIEDDKVRNDDICRNYFINFLKTNSFSFEKFAKLNNGLDSIFFNKEAFAEAFKNGDPEENKIIAINSTKNYLKNFYDKAVSVKTEKQIRDYILKTYEILEDNIKYALKLSQKDLDKQIEDKANELMKIKVK